MKRNVPIKLLVSLGSFFSSSSLISPLLSISSILSIASLSCFAASPVAESDWKEIKPRGYVEEEMPDYKPGENGKPTILTLNYQEEAKGFVEAARQGFIRQHHTGSFKHTSSGWVLTDDTAKKVVIIKIRHSGPKRKTSLAGLQAASQMFPKNVSLLAYVWTTADQQKNWPVALEYYRKAFDPGPPPTSVESLVAPPRSKHDRARVIANCAYLELMMGHYDRAIKQLDLAIAMEPDHAPNYKNRAEAYRKLNKKDLADRDDKKRAELELAQKNKKDDKRNLEIRNSAALFLVAVGSYEEAIKLGNELEKDPTTAGLAHLTKARSLLKMGRYKDCLPEYKTLLALTKDSPVLKAEMATAEQLIKTGPPPYGDLSVLKKDKDTHERKFMKMENGKKEAMTVAQIAADHRGDYRVYMCVASELLAKSNWKLLDAELSKQNTVFPNDSTTISRKIQTSEALENWPETAKYCTAYLDLMAKDSVREFKPSFLKYVFITRALARRAQNNCAGAAADMSEVIKLDPESPEAFRDRGDCYMQCGKFDLAAADYSKAIKYGDSSDATFLRRATAYDGARQHDLATKDRDTAAKLRKTAEDTTEKIKPD